MTHDQLITELNCRLEIALYNGDPQAIHALKAVVELHNPIGTICNWCTCHEDNHIVDYPCKTIRIIELNLQ
jgi:hypothetical protein